MLYNINIRISPYSAAKVLQKNHIRKFFAKKKYNSHFTCIIQKKVVTLRSKLCDYTHEQITNHR